ncbi:MAG: amidohydrolase [Deltaproteobacteria bacterium]|nr:amidohydrolase [Deltaproteobacteria bacterium]MBW2052555.1 amidohydrolase [Deltaproteobacteria bacterium]MBW2141129.1 amidohydrolase [Deltaproteobacteria bacterium]MBW2324343.1 amidohydrolase [Deltaproteobacteria bacterium]
MNSKEELKKRVCEAIDLRRGKIEEIGDKIMREPELGFKEFKTAKLVSNVMEEFKIPHQTKLAFTGVKGELKGKDSGPAVALLGELDSLLVPDHFLADPETGAAHACGHNAQIASLMGAMMGLVDANASEELAGKVVFFAVPAEEYVEVEYRASLVKEGKLGFLGGKPELVRLGHFDDIDMAMMIHHHSNPNVKKVVLGKSSNGCVVKMIRFIGRASHAGQSPHRGINALNAAHVALAAIHAQRETYKDADTIRVHPIITHGGDLVNVVPSEVRMESYVRGKTNKAILDANQKVDRALRAGAMAIGAQVEIETIPGYFPLINDPQLSEIFEDNSAAIVGKDEYMTGDHGAGSTDMGDIAHLMPALHPAIGGAVGRNHGSDYQIADKELAYLASAKLLATMAIDLLYGQAEKAREILADYQPKMKKAQYIKYQQKVFRTEIYDGETGKARFKP